MDEQKKILCIYPHSFIANIYGRKPFRMIGIIDADIKYSYGIETVKLAYFRSSGTNSGKIKGLWYPILGIKTQDGEFVEFTKYINHVLKHSTRDKTANEGWLAKSVFFKGNKPGDIRGFSSGIHYTSLLWIGNKLRELYENNEYIKDKTLSPEKLNEILYEKKKYDGNKHSQRENFEKFVKDIYSEA